MTNFIVNNWTDPWKTIINNIYLHVTIANCQIVCSGWLTQCMNWKFICPSTYWQWKLASDHSRISSVIVKICNVQLHSYKGSLSVNSFKYLFLAKFIPLSISEVHVHVECRSQAIHFSSIQETGSYLLSHQLHLVYLLYTDFLRRDRQTLIGLTLTGTMSDCVKYILIVSASLYLHI